MKIKTKNSGFTDELKGDVLKKPIIFIGSGRTGSTIISETIMKHPDLAFPSNYQNKMYRNSWINLIRIIFDNNFWRLDGKKKQLNKVDYFNRFYFKPDESYDMWNFLTGENIDFSRDFLINTVISEEKIFFIRNYFYKIVKYQRRERLVLKITGPSRIGFLTQIFPDAIFINIKRDIVPTVRSLLKVEFWRTRGMKQLWWTGAFSKDEIKWANDNREDPILLTAFQLKKIYEVTEMELSNLESTFLEVNYESFVKNPKHEISRIMKFTDLRNFDFSYYLKANFIFNQNCRESDFFSINELNKIHKVLNHIKD